MTFFLQDVLTHQGRGPVIFEQLYKVLFMSVTFIFRQLIYFWTLDKTSISLILTSTEGAPHSRLLRLSHPFQQINPCPAQPARTRTDPFSGCTSILFQVLALLEKPS